MKKITITLLFLLIGFAGFATTNNEEELPNKAKTEHTTNNVRLMEIKNRIDEIRHMDKKGMSYETKKSLKKEVKDLKHELKAMRREDASSDNDTWVIIIGVIVAAIGAIFVV